MSNRSSLSIRPVAPKVALVGMVASGKTTLAFTLASRLVKPDPEGYRMVPSDARTLTQSERVWSALNASNWPETTRSLDLVSYRWEMYRGAAHLCDLVLADIAGDDLHYVFSEDRCFRPADLGELHRKVFDYCDTADLVILVINLGDFLGDPDVDRGLSKQAAIKGALDFFRKTSGKRRVALALSQAELYNAEAIVSGGWKRLVQQALPYVYNAHFLHDPPDVIPLSAIKETNIVYIDVHSPDGSKQSVPHRVPRLGFTSENVDKLTKWITQAVEHLKRNSDLTRRPHAVVLNDRVEWRGAFSKRLVWIAQLRNMGANGPVRVIATACEGDQEIETRYEDIDLQSDEARLLEIRFEDPRPRDETKHSVKFKLEAL